MHPFISKDGAQVDLYFEAANDSTLKPENDKSNRAPSRNSATPSKEKLESKNKGEKRYNNENYLDTSGSHMSKASRNIRQK